MAWAQQVLLRVRVPRLEELQLVLQQGQQHAGLMTECD
jgi:hypothetical protein